MNKAITDGLVFMPPAFEDGLDVWSKGNGTAGSASYDGAANAALVAADADFGGCLELLKTDATQKLRYMGQTPILPGCYLQITARVKAISGNLPSVRIAGYAMGAGDLHVSGLTETAPAVALTSYGEVVTVQAIVGSGARGGVDLPWGTQPLYGHFGIDLIGSNGGVVRVDDIEIADVTGYFLRDMMDWVDVRDYGAVGDGTTDDAAAFAAADAAAAGRMVLVPEGTFFIGSTISLESPVRFEGTLSMPDAARLQMPRSFDLPSYVAAFGDEVLGFKKAIQALFNYSDHDSLDMKGLRIDLSAPIDIHAAVGNKDSFAVRRVLRNGQFNVLDSTDWAPTVVTSQGTYNITNPLTLTAVTDVANVPVGAKLSGTGVGREIYVTAKNVGAGTVTLSKPFYGGSGTQVFTFTRFKYVLDFSGFSALSRFNIDDVEFLCNGYASCILLAPSGDTFHLRDCFVTRPKDRGITSIGGGCQDLLVDRCSFISNEIALRSQDRTSIAINVNANDTKIRDNRAVRFGHFMVANGSGHLITGNHWFQGDEETAGLRVAGLVLTQTNVKTLVVGNYIDNSHIEWTNEYETEPAFESQFSFGGLTVTGNIFTTNDVANWFKWFVVKPYGEGHFIQGLTFTGNVFRSLNGSVQRIEGVDTSFASLDMGRMRNVVMENNTFTGVDLVSATPVYLQHDQATEATVWTVDPGVFMPFGAWARNVESLVAEGAITTASGARVTEMPYVAVEQGTQKQQVTLNWSVACKGRVQIRVRMDNPN